MHYILPDTAENNLRTVWLKLSEVYAARQIPDRYSNLKLTMFSAKGGCKLKGRAAELRNFGHALHPVWNMYWNPSAQKDRVMLAIVLSYGKDPGYISSRLCSPRCFFSLLLLHVYVSYKVLERVGMQTVLYVVCWKMSYRKLGLLPVYKR